jgi:hypothetical protein
MDKSNRRNISRMYRYDSKEETCRKQLRKLKLQYQLAKIEYFECDPFYESRKKNAKKLVMDLNAKYNVTLNKYKYYRSKLNYYKYLLGMEI